MTYGGLFDGQINKITNYTCTYCTYCSCLPYALSNTYCGCRDNGNTIVTAGSDKIVCIYDSRMLKCRFKWRSPCKYDIAKLIACHSPPRSPVGGADDAQQLSSQERHKHLMYVAGRDNEVLLCDIEINDIKVRSKSKVPLPYKDRSLAHAEDKARSGDMECADTADNSSKRLKIMEEDDSGAKEGVTGVLGGLDKI